LLYWWPVVQPWPSRARWPRWTMIPYLLLADLQNTALAAFLSFQDRVLYSTYESAPRIFGISALEDQAGAGALMWVPGSLAFILPAGFIAWQFLSPRRAVRPSEHARHGKPPPPGPTLVRKENPVTSLPLDLFHVRGLGVVMRWTHFRKSLQILMLGLAAFVVADGIRGPQVSALNAAGVLPWTHWRTLTVVALLVAGNLFCMACPFTFVRDLGRKILPARAAWPSWLRTKWLAVGLLVVYLWAYEAFDLWDRPLATALLILGYFVTALLVDGFFRGASFCQFVCPIGQFHFVQSLVSPFEIKVREPDACLTCKTHDCLRGNASQRGCELHLFQPRKAGNMDCTFCLDCVKACPHDNVGFLAVMPGREVIRDEKKSTVGTYARRPDIAALVLVLTFGAFVNAAGMVVPVLEGMDALTSRWELSSDLLLVSLLMAFGLVILPGAASLGAAWLGGGKKLWRDHLCRFAVALAPLGFGMWLAHFVFHFFTAALTPVPVLGRVLEDFGWISSSTAWVAPSPAFYDLPALEIVLLNAGYLLCLFMLWRIAARAPGASPRRAFSPWAVIATTLYLLGLWIIFQPMEMRGTLMH
ncbi:MAG: cytochrome c oxidase assembly protein, partial [Terrimicrobiaceae bacterium]